MWRMASALTLTVALSACSQPGGEGGASADCAVAVRFEGTIYVEAGFSRLAAEKLGSGDLSSCADVGRDARGMYFADDPAHVSVWSFPGFDSGHVIGVRESEQRVRVLFAENLPISAKRQIQSLVLRSVRRQSGSRPAR